MASYKLEDRVRLIAPQDGYLERRLGAVIGTLGTIEGDFKPGGRHSSAMVRWDSHPAETVRCSFAEFEHADTPPSKNSTLDALETRIHGAYDLRHIGAREVLDVIARLRTAEAELERLKSVTTN